ncbi:MAG: hypothetical protein J3R72DRAFT_235413 [Linnemannia gamsii]|nr:MAG: hypothetical protein J3R72DRAFT_235413 [Linnemannia gamsii]
MRTERNVIRDELLANDCLLSTFPSFTLPFIVFFARSFSISARFFFSQTKQHTKTNKQALCSIPHFVRTHKLGGLSHIKTGKYETRNSEKGDRTRKSEQRRMTYLLCYMPCAPSRFRLDRSLAHTAVISRPLGNDCTIVCVVLYVCSESSFFFCCCRCCLSLRWFTRGKR